MKYVLYIFSLRILDTSVSGGVAYIVLETIEKEWEAKCSYLEHLTIYILWFYGLLKSKVDCGHMLEVWVVLTQLIICFMTLVKCNIDKLVG